MRLRAIALASLLALPPLLTLSPGAPLRGPAPAEASISVLLSLDELVAASALVVVGTPGERRSQWEEMPSGKRIVTYTTVKVDRSITGSAGSEIVVRTLGGTVGDIGQAVSGEAQLARGSKAVLFLMKRGDVTMVTGMAQGHFPVVNDDKGVARLKASPDVGTTLRTPGPVIAARDVLVGQTVDVAVTSITKARKALDEKKK